VGSCRCAKRSCLLIGLEIWIERIGGRLTRDIARVEVAARFPKRRTPWLTI